jgi:uncharacterized protein
MKNIKLWLISTFLLFTALQSSHAESLDKQGILHPNGLLWKIEKPAMPESYLFGTMHVNDPKVTKLSPKVEQAFMQAEHFVMEVLLNFQAMGYMASSSYFNDGRTLQDVMSPVEYKRLGQLISQRLGISEGVMKHMKPWAILMMLMVPQNQQADQQSGQPNMESALDMQLYRRASQRKIKLTGLESIQEQIAIFESMSLQDQLWMLNRSIEDIEKTDQQMPEMLNAYVARDLAKLVKIQQAAMYDDSEIDDQFMYQLVNVRNERMVKRMLPVLKQGNAFIAIGALHLPGEDGVLHLLEKQGFTVTSIY